MDRRMSEAGTSYCVDEGQKVKPLDDDARENDIDETTSGVVSVREASFSPEPEYNYRERQLHPHDEAAIRRLGQEMVWDRLGLRLSESPSNSSGEQEAPTPSSSKMPSPPPNIRLPTYDWPVLTTTPISSPSPSREDVRIAPSKPTQFSEAPLLLSEFAIIPPLPDDMPAVQSPSWRIPSPIAMSEANMDDVDLPSEKGVMRRCVNPRRSATPYTIPRRRGIRVRVENKKLNHDVCANNR
uniref:PEHE domain-containing protein n=1 Tax=Panagrellus redivivus TaxID=6233 RepID=A0A7E4VVU4_PANRE